MNTTFLKELVQKAKRYNQALNITIGSSNTRKIDIDTLPLIYFDEDNKLLIINSYDGIIHKTYIDCDSISEVTVFEN
jgi:hypothetical protein